MISLDDVKRAIRDKYAWPGGYPLYLVMADGEVLSIDAARAEFRHIVRAHIDKCVDKQWVVVGVCINWENAHLYCSHTGERIECAYGEE